jgi:hypothetical protein
MKRPRGPGSIFQCKGSRNWFLKYYRDGKPVRESSHSDKKKVAEKMLAKRLAEISTDTYIEPSDRKVTVDELYAALLAAYKNNEMASHEGAQQRWQAPAKKGQEPPPGRLKEYFGGIRALAVTTDKLNKYIAWCREKQLSNGTINRELAALRRAFNLALRAGKLQKVPFFPHLKQSAARSGFVEERCLRQTGEECTRPVAARSARDGLRIRLSQK